MYNINFILSQILNQNDNNVSIKNLSHILDRINNSNIYNFCQN